MLNLATILESSASEHADKLAVILDDHRLTHAQLNAAANQVANALVDAGIERGDRVAVLLANTPHFPIVYYGILKAGAIVVPLNVLLKGREVAYHLDDSGARLLVAFEMFAQEAVAGARAAERCEAVWIATADPAAEPPVTGQDVTTLGRAIDGRPAAFDTVQTMPDDTAVILYTSGTTGQPKGAELSHFNVFYNAECIGGLVDVSHDDISVGVLPLFHSFGQVCVMNAAFYAGGTMTLVPRFDPEKVLQVMARDAATIFAGVPTMYWALLNCPEKDRYIDDIRPNLRLCNSGGAAMPVELMKQFEETFGVTILEGYGLSETSPVATFNRSRETRKPGSIGLPIQHTRLRIVDDEDNEMPRGERGEIVIRGHNVMKGYLGRPEATADAMRNDWFHTGDIGYMDDDGFIFIVDRKKDMVLRAGFNVYPREVEETLMTHPAVSLVAVVGVPDDKLGEEVKAFIVRNHGHDTSEDRIIAWCKENMAAYKYPRVVEFRDSLPMTATGKILKRQLV